MKSAAPSCLLAGPPWGELCVGRQEQGGCLLLWVGILNAQQGGWENKEGEVVCVGPHGSKAARDHLLGGVGGTLLGRAAIEVTHLGASFPTS